MSVCPALAVGYRWQHRSLSWEPLIGLGLSWSRLYFTPTATTAPTNSFWRLRVDGGLVVRWAVSNRLHLLAEGMVSALPSREQFKHRLDQTVILTTPWGEWGLAAGAEWPF